MGRITSTDYRKLNPNCRFKLSKSKEGFLLFLFTEKRNETKSDSKRNVKNPKKFLAMLRKTMRNGFETIKEAKKNQKRNEKRNILN